LCTKGGLSRFDGYQFTNYTVADGLPHQDVMDWAETRGGVYWVATRGGLCRFLPDARRKFVAHPLNGDEARPRGHVLLEDRAGRVWCGTDQGLYRLELAGEVWTSCFVDLRRAAGSSGPLWVTALREDRRGDLWIGTTDGLFRRRPDGRVDHYMTAQGLSDNA